MASITITETGVTLSVQVTRNELGEEAVRVSAASLTDTPQAAIGRTMDTDITGQLTAPQLAQVTALLDFIEAKVKTQWNIP